MLFKYESSLPKSVFDEVSEKFDETIVDQPWEINPTAHSWLTCASVRLNIPIGVLDRIIQLNYGSHYAVYLSFYRTLIQELQDLNNGPHLPYLLSEYRDYLLSPEKISQYLASDYNENDRLFRCLCFTFHDNPHNMSKSAIKNHCFESLDHQIDAYKKLTIYISTFLKSGYVSTQEIGNIPDHFVKQDSNLIEFSSHFRSMMKGFERMTSIKGNEISSVLRDFIDNLEYYWTYFEEKEDGESVIFDEYTFSYRQSTDDFLLSGPEGDIEISNYEDICSGDLPNLPFEFQRFVFRKKKALLTMFPIHSLKNSRDSQSVFTDVGGFYVIKTGDMFHPKFYLESLEMTIDYLASRVLEELLPSCPNFARIFSCHREWKIARHGIAPSATVTIPRFCIMPHLHGLTLYTHLFSKTFEDLDIILVEIFAALQDAYDACGFCHYDLHCSNVVMSPVDNTYTWRWRGYSLEVQRRYRPVIIDFGRSRLEVDGRVLGRHWTPAQESYLQIDRSRAYPAHDIFKLMALCYKYSRNEVVSNAIKHFFGGEYLEWKYSYGAALFSLPYLEKYASLQYQDVVKYFLEIR